MALLEPEIAQRKLFRPTVVTERKRFRADQEIPAPSSGLFFLHSNLKTKRVTKRVKSVIPSVFKTHLVEQIVGLLYSCLRSRAYRLPTMF